MLATCIAVLLAAKIFLATQVIRPYLASNAATRIAELLATRQLGKLARAL